LRLLEARSDTHIREQCLDRLRAYATTAELPALEALAARPAISPEFKEAVQKTIRAIRQRAGTSR
jgi:hypothetical protein